MLPRPVRGAAVRELGLTLPPGRMAPLRGGRQLKRWTWVGVFGDELQLCAGQAAIGPVRTRWWAVAEPGRPLAERTAKLGAGGIAVDPAGVAVRSGGARIELRLEPAGEPMEIVTPAGRAWIWTEKRPCVARGTVEVGGVRRSVEAPALVDSSAGYHDRRTSWLWSAGAGEASDGRRVFWNLVSGIHDRPEASERTVWVGGEPVEAGPVEIARDLSAVASADGCDLRFAEWAVRQDATSALVMRNVYRQPFGAFEGSLPGGIELARGRGVMEAHDVVW
jgi:hypothetical protein